MKTRNKKRDQMILWIYITSSWTETVVSRGNKNKNKNKNEKNNRLDTSGRKKTKKSTCGREKW